MKGKKKQQSSLTYREFIDALFAYRVDDEYIDKYSAQLKQFIKYAWDMFLYLPRAVQYLNQYVNDYEHTTQSLREQVLFLQDFIKRAKISRSDIRTTAPSFELRSQLKSDIGKDFGTNDVNVLYSLSKMKILSLENLIIKVDQRRPDGLTKEEKELVKKAVQEHYEKNSSKVDESMIIGELTQEIIDELDLTLFDISILDKSNKILYVFIDKDNKKRLYIEPFGYRFEIHPAPSILDKDYFVSKSEVYPYVITDVKDYMRLRGAINNNFKSVYQIPMSR